jgi:hypothetical protein
MNSKLLDNIYYGYETNTYSRSLTNLGNSIASNVAANYQLPLNQLANDIDCFFTRPYEGIFGGQITAGDAAFIYSMMHALQPTHMIEFGVASGYSSAFILHSADVLGLTSKQPFLTSFDIDDGSLSGKNVGSFLRNYYPQFMPQWRFHAGKTSLDMMRDPCLLPFATSRPQSILAFVDGGHNHPWPALDLLALYCTLNNMRCSDGTSNSHTWVMMQDVRMMERWIMDCIRFAVPCPAPVRGVELAFALWPGAKFSGLDICYNMAAIDLNISVGQLLDFLHAISTYQFECDFDRDQFAALIREASVTAL